MSRLFIILMLLLALTASRSSATTIGDMTPLGAAPASNDLLEIEDVSGPSGRSITIANLFTSPSLTTPTLGVATATSLNGLTITSSTGTLTITNGKTLTSSNTLTLAGTDGSTLNIGTGGTLGTAAFTAATAYEVPLTFSTGLTRSTNTITVNTTQNIAKLSNLTSNGVVHTSGADGTLGIAAVDIASEVTGTLPVANGGTGITSLGTGVATWLGTPSSANLASAVTGETGSGALVFGTAPVFPTKITIGAAAATTGSIELLGTTSGTVTVKVADAAGTWTATLPDNDGDSGQFLATNGSGVLSWSTPAGSGDVSKVGTPANNQMAVWTGDGTLEGTSDLTYDGTSLNLITAKNFQIAGGTVLADSSGTLTLSGIDAIDATTEATLEAALEGTSLQGYGTGVATALAVNVGTDGAFVTRGGNAGTPSAITLTNGTGLPAAGVTGTALTQASKADAIQAAQIVTLTSSSTDTYAGTAGVTATAYTTGTTYVFVANTANTGACSLNIDSLGAKTIKKVAGGVTTDLADNDIRNGQVCIVSYDGTNFQLQSTLGNAASGGGGLASTDIDTSSELAAILTDETGWGSGGKLMFNKEPVFDSGGTSGAYNTQSLYMYSGGYGHRIYSKHHGSDSTENGVKLMLWTSGSSGDGPGVLGWEARGVNSTTSILKTGGAIQMPQISALGTADSNTALIGVKDVGGTAEVFVKDEAGNETQISPHNTTAPTELVDNAFDEIGFSMNYYTGLVTYTNRQRQRAGRLDFQWIETFAEHNARLGLSGDAALVQLDWDSVQAALVMKRNEEIARWQAARDAWDAIPENSGKPYPGTGKPPAITAKPQPAWLTAQLSARAGYLTSRTAIAQSSADLHSKRTAVKNAVPALRQWKTDADAAGAAWDGWTQAQKNAAMKTVIQRFGVLCDRLADLAEGKGVGQ